MTELTEQINNTYTVENLKTTLESYIPVLSTVVIAGFVYSMVRRMLYGLSRGRATI